MKKMMVPLMMVITLMFAVIPKNTNASNPSIDSSLRTTLETMFPATFPSGFVSAYHACLKSQYIHMLSDSEFKTALKQLFDGNYYYWQYGETVREVYHKEWSAMYAMNLSWEEMKAIVDEAVFGLPPADMKKTYFILRIRDEDGKPEWAERGPYIVGQPIEFPDKNNPNVVLKRIIPRTEKALKNPSGLMLTLNSCGNPTIPHLEESDEVYKKPDTVKVPDPCPAHLDLIVHDTPKVNQQNEQTVKIILEDRRSDAKPDDHPNDKCNHDCNHKKDKVPFGQSLGGQILANAIGGTVAEVVGEGINRAIYGNRGNTVYGQQNPIIYGNGGSGNNGGIIYQGGSGAGNGNGNIPNNSGSSGGNGGSSGGNSNTWLRDPSTGQLVLANTLTTTPSLPAPQVGGAQHTAGIIPGQL